MGFSGGADSTALLHVLSSLSAELGVRLIAAHLHHAMRGEEADADAEHCAGVARRLGVPFHVRRIDVIELARERKLNIEEAGRVARYEFLEAVRQEAQADYITTGHTLDDHAETVIMHLMRGAGLRGLRGIAPIRGTLLRPLLAVTRAQTARYCESNGLRTVVDRTNFELGRERAGLRHRLTTAVTESYKEYSFRSIARLSEIIAAEDELLATLTDDVFRSLKAPQPSWVESLGIRPLEVALNAEGIKAQPIAVQRRLILHAIEYLQPSHEAGFKFVDAVREALARGVESGFNVPTSNVGIATTPETLRAWVKWQATSYRLTLIPDRPVRIPVLDFDLVLREGESKPCPCRSQACLDRQSLKGDLYVEPYAPAKYRPVGGKAARPIKDLLWEAGVPERMRPHIPVVHDELGPVWAFGCRAAERAVSTSRTTVSLLVSGVPKDPAV
ncbi:MAG: tRNA lysidine(34) synthetase TilS [Fimbriimonadia bacterium]